MPESAGIGTSLPGWHRCRQCVHVEIDERSSFAPCLGASVVSGFFIG